MRPICIDLESQPVQALLNEPAAARANGISLLICPPFGWEEMCSYRPRRTWATRAAEQGFLTARFDPPATGDSGGSPSEPGLFDTWIRATAEMSRWLREQQPGNRVAVLGLGLGGMLAWRALEEGAEIDELVLWSVPSRGRTLLREMRAHAAVIAALHHEDHAHRGTPSPGAPLDIVGYALTPSTADSLIRTDLTAAPVPPRLQRVLLLRRDGVDPDIRLCDHLNAHDIPVTVTDGDGYGEMMVHPQLAQARPEPIEATLRWLAAPPQRPAGRVSDGDPAARGRVPPSGPAMRIRAPAGPLRETPFEIPYAAGNMFGVLCQPQAPRHDLCAVLFSAGALRHTGPHRMHVELARRWAARGISTVRVDLWGIGEADGEDPGLLTDAGLCRSDRLLEVRAVFDELRERLPGRRFVVAGLCSGAYCALHGALAEPGIRAAMMVNLYAFEYSEELAAERELRASTAALRGNIVTRLREGRLRREHLIRGIRSFSPGNLRRASQSVEARQAPAIERAFDELRDAGTQLTFVFSRGEGLDAQLEHGGQWRQLGRWPNITIERLPTRDHLFRALWLQAHVHAVLDRALDRVLATEATG